MASEPKTKPTGASVADFLAAVENPTRRADAQAVCALLEEVTGEPPMMWGPSIVGFGSYHYRYASGQSGDWPIAGFSPRKANLVLYIMAGAAERPDLLARLGKARTSVSCLYVNRLSDVDMGVLRELAEWSVRTMRERYPAA